MYLRLGLLPRTAVRQRTQGTAWHEQITSRETIYITILMSFTCVFSGKGGGEGEEVAVAVWSYRSIAEYLLIFRVSSSSPSFYSCMIIALGRKGYIF